MKQLLVSLLLGCGFISTVFAQSRLIVPRAHQNAYAKETRCKDGSPGKKYWQNRSDYAIRAALNIKEKNLTGKESIVYYNNSPDTIRSIVFRLYQDIFKKGANRNPPFNIDPSDIGEGVIIHQVRIDTMLMNQKDLKRNGTLMTVKMPQAVVPNSRVKIEIGWSFHIPENTLIRMGAIDTTSLFVAQWYPQIAVYDDINGWDTHQYNGMAEFYNDVANFDVEITVPEKFVVWATGEPTNLKEVLQPSIFQKYQKAAVSDEIVPVISKEDLSGQKITTSRHVWKFKAQDVTDFAFGLSDHYVWDASSVIVDSTTNRRTLVAAAYNSQSPHFDKVVGIAKETVRAMSFEMPAIPFPFSYITVYNGSFGMEYPMMTNVGAYDDYTTTVYANSHEIAHAYFPFYVCTNETTNGWLDEGFTVFLPEKVQNRMESTFNEARITTSSFDKYAGREDEPALITSSFYLDSKIYFYLNYAKAEQALRMLEIELGKSTFKKCLLTFMHNWKLKHPTPFDFFNTFNAVSGQNLDWFWNAWYFQQGGIPDLAIKKVTRNQNHFHIVVANLGDIPLPVTLSFYNGNKQVRTIERSAKSLFEHPEGISIDFEAPETITKIILGSDTIADANRNNNVYVVE